MTLYRNTSDITVNGPDGTSVFPQQDVDLTDTQLKDPQVMVETQQRRLVPVTMAATEQRGAAPASSSADAGDEQ